MNIDHKLHNILEQIVLKIHQNYGQVNQKEHNIILDQEINLLIQLNLNLQ